MNNLRILLAIILVSAAGAELPPNIVFYLADDMGMGDTSAYQDWTGNADHEQVHTPALERLAASGIRFTDAHSPSSRCSLSRYALLTGRYCWRTRLKHWVLFGVQCDPLIKRAQMTLPEFLQQQGYRTGMVGKWHLGLTYTQSDGTPASGWDDADMTKPIADGPLDHGFDYFTGISRSHPTSGPHKPGENSATQAKGPGWIQQRKIMGATGDGKRLDASYVLDQIGPRLHEHATAFVKDNARKEAPFFLYFAAASNHTPHTPCKAIASRPVAGASTYKDGSPTLSRRLDFIHENDVQLGLILDQLDTRDDPRRPGHKLIENTLLIFASDNGAEVTAKTATGPLRSNKGSVYEGGHRIPFLASWPVGGIAPRSQSTRLLGLNDMFATFAEILDQAPPAQAAEDSLSQLAALRGESMDPRPALFPNDHIEAAPGGKHPHKDRRAWVAVRSNAAPITGQWKLFLDHTFAYRGEINPKELYNLANDPQEAANLLNDPSAKPALAFLIDQAQAAAGDHGRTRP